MNYEVKEQLYEGKAKQVFATNDPEIVMVHYKDDATAGDGEKKGTIRDKGIVNNKLSNALMQKLEKEGIPTHYVQEVNDRDTFVKKVEIVPLEVIVRNVAAVTSACAWACPRARSLRPHPRVQLQERRSARPVHQPLLRPGPRPGYPGGAGHHREVCLQGQRGAEEDHAGRQHPSGGL